MTGFGALRWRCQLYLSPVLIFGIIADLTAVISFNSSGRKNIYPDSLEAMPAKPYTGFIILLLVLKQKKNQKKMRSKKKHRANFFETVLVGQ